MMDPDPIVQVGNTTGVTTENMVQPTSSTPTSFDKHPIEECELASE